MTWSKAEASGRTLVEKKYSETLEQNFEHVYIFVLLDVHNEKSDGLLCRQEGRFMLALPTRKEMHCLC